MPCILCWRSIARASFLGTGLSHQLAGDAISHGRCMQNIPNLTLPKPKHTDACQMQHNWAAATVSRRAKHMQELDSWLEHLPAATIMEKSLATCTPADLLVYMESHWLPNHAGTMLPDGSMIASPSGSVGACHICPLASCSSAELGTGIPQPALLVTLLCAQTWPSTGKVTGCRPGAQATWKGQLCQSTAARSFSWWTTWTMACKAAPLG
jgi:hypothetical protein